MGDSEESAKDGFSGTDTDDEIKEINILSFDGGGSKGMMEVFILKDVFNFLTILQRDSVQLQFLLSPGTSLDTKEGREELRRLLDNCEKPIHPTEAFDFIVGTSVGSLTAFGLVGGKKTEQERTSMEVEEIIQMFKDCTQRMFDTKADTGWISWMKGKVKGMFLPFPAIPYSQEGLEKILIERFGDLYLGGFPRPHGCVAGAVAKSINHKTGVAGNEVLFTTRGLNDMYKVVEVLKASSAAPIYFETPAMIGDEAYIDGGDGGNCPLAQALEAIPEIFGEGVKVGSVLSIAPPRTVIGPIPEDNQWMYWLSYFPSQVTDGAAVYHHVTRSHRHINCQRLFPKSEEGKKFKLDEKNVEAMISCMEKEAIEESLVGGVQQLQPEDIANLNNKIGSCYKRKACYDKAKEYFQKTELIIKDHQISPFVVAETYYNLGDCYLYMENIQEAIHYYIDSLECGIEELKEKCQSPKILEEVSNAIAFSYNDLGDKYKSPEIREEVSNVIALSYNGLGNCYLKQEKFKEAEKYYVKSLEEKKEVSSVRDRMYKAKLLNDAAVCSLMTGKHDYAIRTLKESLKINEEIFGIHAKSLTIAGSHTNLGNCYMKKKEYDKAIDSYRTSHEMNTQIFGEDAAIPCMAETYNNLGICFLNKKEKSIDEALSFFNSSLDIKRRVYGEDKPFKSIARTYNNLGKSMMEMSQHDEAMAWHSKSLQMKIEIYGDNPSILSIAVSYQNLGDCCLAIGDEEKAHYYFEKIKKVDAEELLEGDFYL